MKTLFENLQALLNDPPQFKFKYLMLKCPDFIVNAILAKQERALEKPEFRLKRTPAATANSPEINIYQYQPEYQ